MATITIERRISGIALVRFRESRRARILEPALPIRLANGELRDRARRCLRFNARQTRADQRPVQAHRFFFRGRRRLRQRVILCRGSRAGRRHLLRRGLACRACRLGRGGRFVVRDQHAGRFCFFLHRLEDLVICGRHRALLPLPRNFAAFVRMLRVARRAPRKAHFIADHRDHGVIREPALARTIVVQNVTKP